uniref:Uncharacterized protein n=1 Tax=Candidatus Kentrum sp. LFY TaxID=2126342 RepID=A0A450WGX0_9GAMM|nr:MAG: hypothetical protein BECKLFY1418C_GA0070996_102211 [Candidatus Kentron sp. LFY]
MKKEEITDEYMRLGRSNKDAIRETITEESLYRMRFAQYGMSTLG